jgi:hypothetical protein
MQPYGFIMMTKISSPRYSCGNKKRISFAAPEIIPNNRVYLPLYETSRDQFKME